MVTTVTTTHSHNRDHDTHGHNSDRDTHIVTTVTMTHASVGLTKGTNPTLEHEATFSKDATFASVHVTFDFAGDWSANTEVIAICAVCMHACMYVCVYV